MFTKGTVVVLSYPASTHIERIGDSRLRQRQLIVRSIRDLVAEPLTPEEFLRRPFIRRSRWLVHAYELEFNRFRQFYIGSSLEYSAPSQLRVALYEPGAIRPSEILFRGIEPTMKDRKLLTRAILQWQHRDFGNMLVRIYADDLRLHA